MGLNFLSGRQIRQIREYITAYLMIAPATLLIFLFGIFPVGFALYVSLHKWRIKRGKYLGLENYIKALDNLTYVLIFVLAIAALLGGFFLLRRIIRRKRESGNSRDWLMALPGALFSVTILAFIRWTVVLLPEILAIANKIWGMEKTRELFMQLLREAFTAPDVVAAWRLYLILFLLSIAVLVALLHVLRASHRFNQVLDFTLLWIIVPAGLGMLWITFRDIRAVYRVAAASGADPGVWPQVISITAGVILLVGAWFLWKRATRQQGNLAFVGHLLAATSLLVGAWLLIGELPTAVAAGDEDMWTGLKVTAFYSLGTVPFQLAFSMFLAILLFQKLWGSDIFRMFYFLPYVTPTVASAAIFRQLFSNRYQAPANQLFIKLGLEPQDWIRESHGIFTMLGESMGLTVPDWAAGPSLALVVIMIYSIWTFVGYDTVIYLAGLGNIPTPLIESAEIDGAGPWAKFRYIIFPLLSPTTYFLSLIAIIGTFKAFNHIWVMREASALGTTDTFSVIIFSEFYEKLRYGYASALAFVLFAIILTLTLLNQRLQGTRVFYG